MIPIDIYSFLILAVIAAMALLLLHREGLLDRPGRTVFVVLLIVAAFFIRFLCMEHETLDYQNFLAVWVQFFRDNGGWRALSQNIGNYNVPYLYFLALFSYSGIRDLYLIKLLSIFFDVLLAFGVMRLTALFTDRSQTKLFAFFAVLFLPTVILNGAYWGQCDSIYAALAVLAVFCALDNRPILSIMLITASFAFKLQAVFVLPVWLAFLYTRRIKWRHLVFFPLTYLLIIAPAVLMGRPLMDTLLLYVNQGSTVGSALNYNSPSVFALINDAGSHAELFTRLGIIAAFVFMGLILFFLYLYRSKLSARHLLCAAALLSLAIPFFLPHMHERYFFIADILLLAFAFAAPQYFLLPLGCQFASLLGYHAYLKMRYLFPMRYGALVLLVIIILLSVELLASLPHGRKKGRYA